MSSLLALDHLKGWRGDQGEAEMLPACLPGSREAVDEQKCFT